MMNENIAIKVKHLTKVYKLYDRPVDRLKESLHPLRKKYGKDFHALSDLSFEIKKGETVGIIGKNGSGKSTLLKMLTGVINPTSGSLIVDGRISAILELGAGFNPDMTGLENVYLNTSINGMSKEETDKKIDDIIQFAELGEFIHQPIKSYSSGMQARLAFSVSINVDPEILIVDEALSVGDMNFQAKCMTAMDRIKNKGTTILFVSHDINSVKSLCQRAIYIKKGQMIDIGKASDMAELYIKDMREGLNEIYKQNEKFPQESIQTTQTQKFNQAIGFKTSKKFDDDMANFRYGTGDAKITFVELLDMNNEVLIEVDFNQEVKIRVYLESNISEDVAVNFQLCDDKKIKIVSGGFKQIGENLLKVVDNGQYIIEYVLKLPLREDIYSLRTIVASYPDFGNTPKYIDVLENALVFKINQKPTFPIWSKVDLFPKLTVSKV